MLLNAARLLFSNIPKGQQETQVQKRGLGLDVLSFVFA